MSDSDFSLSTTKQPAKRARTKRIQIDSDSDDVFDFEINNTDSDYAPSTSKAKKQPAKKRKVTKKTPIDIDSSDNDISDNNYTQSTSKGKKQPAKTRKVTKKTPIDIDGSDNDISDNNFTQSTSKGKKQPVKRAKATEITQMDIDGSDNDISDVAEASSSKMNNTSHSGKTVEEIYQKKTQIEHVLLRPDTYIGSVESVTEKLWIYDSETDSMVYKDVTIVPGLYKIVDEILVNAADNKIRDPSMNTIKVRIDKEQNLISIYNNGKGIPIEMHKEENVYVPELIFGHLLTSSNYNDSEKKVTGGRNGYGAKLTNIFSTEFIVETTDTTVKKKYRQIFKKNMSIKENPKLTSYSKKEEYTEITFKPDLEKFGLSELTDDIIGLLKKRVFDMAGCCKNVKVILNDERIKIRNFKEYIQKYLPPPNTSEDS
ncbi:8618_t:CDS:2, partial [Scutellospora calospora]